MSAIVAEKCLAGAFEKGAWEDLEIGAAVLVKLEKVLLVAGLLSREADVSSVLLKAADADINAL